MTTTNISWDDIAAECGIPITEVEQIGAGWGTVVFRTSHDLVFKLGKHEGSYDQLATEAEILRLIKGQLPIRTPQTIMEVGKSQAWPFGYAVQEYVEGVSLSSRWQTYDSLIATKIGAALRSLHSIDVSPEQRASLPRLDRRKLAMEFVGPASQKIELRMGQSKCRALNKKSTGY